jgi:probable addiction module antidote protein
MRRLMTLRASSGRLAISRAQGITQVAKKTGLSRESLYRALIENGNPSFATVLKVARALGVKLHAEAA